MSFSAATDRMRLTVLIGLELAVVVGLHALARLEAMQVGWGDVSAWLESSSAEEAIGSITVLVALAVAYWLLFSTLSYLFALKSRRQGVIGFARRVTHPAIRSLVARTVALSIAASSLVGPVAPAVARWIQDEPAVIVELDSEGRLHPPGTEDDSAPNRDPLVPPHLQMPIPPIVEQPVDVEPVGQSPAETSFDPRAASSHRVVHGDHLWSISEAHLERVTGRDDLCEHEIAPYWVRVIDANRSTIRSGDPDLIFPGEVVSLPAVEG